MVIVALTCRGASLPGAELVVRDLALSLDVQPTSFSYTVHVADGSRSGDDAFDGTLGIVLGGRWSFAAPGSSLGLIVGGDLFYDTYAYRDDIGSTASGVRLHAGLGWAASDTWQFAIGPTWDYGRAEFDFPASSALPGAEVGGAFSGFGALASASWYVSERWSATLGLGWKTLDARLSGGGLDLDLEQAGPCATIGVAHRFSSAPPGLE